MWLMKAEPDSRIVKGKDVKFSVDDFEALGVSPWDGVRSHEAKNIMRDKMKIGDKVLFYHSNTKVPGIFALAEVAKEGYPDHTAWDPSHPYHDAKSDKDKPTWYMVDIRFVERVEHPVTLANLKAIAAGTLTVPYLSAEDVGAVKDMYLLNRGRLSVQPVSQVAYETVVLLGRKGLDAGLNKGRPKSTASKESTRPEKPTGAKKRAADAADGERRRSARLR